MLDRLDAAMSPQDMMLPGFGLHQLKGECVGRWAASVSGNWRVVFELEGTDAINVDHVDYHWRNVQVAEGRHEQMTTRRPAHPGELFLEDDMKPLGLTVTEAARNLGVTRKTLSELVNQHANLRPEMALRIATKTTPESWLLMQTKLDLWRALQKKPTTVRELQRVRP